MEKLFLTEEEIWPGMEIFIFSSRGLVLSHSPVLKCFEWTGGKKRFFLLEGDAEEVEKFLLPQKKDETETGNYISRVSFSGFFPDVKFSPIWAWKFPLNGSVLPPRTEYAVFRGGKVLNYDGEYSNCPVVLWADQQGEILSSSHSAKSLFRQKFSLPKGAILVPISPILGFPSILSSKST